MEELYTTGGTAYRARKITLEEVQEPIEVEKISRNLGELIEVINSLRMEISILTDKVDNLEKNITLLPEATTTPDIVLVEEINKEAAKQMVLDYMKEHKESDVIELHKNIGCEIKILVEIIDELQREGKIQEE